MSSWSLWLHAWIRRTYKVFRPWMMRSHWRRYGPLLPAALLAGFIVRMWRPNADTTGALFVGIIFLVAYFLFKVMWENSLYFRPFNASLRYFVVLDILKAWRPLFLPYPRLLEAGSGLEGIANMIPYPVYGYDMSFEGAIAPTLTPTVGSAADMPFEDNAFDVLISLDTMEHIPTEPLRRQALEEMWRVAKRGLIIGYPAGSEAMAAEKELASYYRGRHLPYTSWLEEHLANGLPSEDLLETVLGGRCPIAIISHEPIRFHLWLSMKETYAFWNLLFLLILLFLRPVIQRVCRKRLSGVRPAYRRIYVLGKDPEVMELFRKSGLSYQMIERFS